MVIVLTPTDPDNPIPSGRPAWIPAWIPGPGLTWEFLQHWAHRVHVVDPWLVAVAVCGALEPETEKNWNDLERILDYFIYLHMTSIVLGLGPQILEPYSPIPWCIICFPYVPYWQRPKKLGTLLF